METRHAELVSASIEPQSPTSRWLDLLIIAPPKASVRSEIWMLKQVQHDDDGVVSGHATILP
jgi:hypothetical protein